MDSQNHWEKIYTEKAPTAVSWYRPHLETSVSLIERVATKESAIIDVGGGESTLVDDLLSHGYNNITVLDISRRAIDENIKRLGIASEGAHWLVADITKAELRESIYDVRHDRAVFHFLTQQSDRIAYVRQAARCEGGWTCDRQHFRTGRPDEMQRPRCRAIRCRIVTPGV